MRNLEKVDKTGTWEERKRWRRAVSNQTKFGGEAPTAG